MNKNNDMITDLLKDKDTIRNQIAVLEADLEAVDRLLKRHSSNHQVEIPITAELLQPNALGLTEAVTQLFEEPPSKEWSPAEIRNRLNEMNRIGEIKSNARDFLPSVHLIIKRLIKNNIVEMTREQTDPVRKWYKKINTMNERKLVKYDI